MLSHFTVKPSLNTHNTCLAMLASPSTAYELPEHCLQTLPFNYGKGPIKVSQPGQDQHLPSRSVILLQ